MKDKQQTKIIAKGKRMPPIVMPQFNNVESAKIGEIVLSSEVLSAQDLLELIFLSLKQPAVQNYLSILEMKKKSTGYIG